MSITFSPKPADAIYNYAFTPVLADGDDIASYTLTPTGVSVQADEEDSGTIEMFLAGGVNGVTASVLVIIETVNGESIRETLYVPITASGSVLENTAQQIIDFALRPVAGIEGIGISDAERADALEWLNAMLASWADQGASVGASFPLALNTVIPASNAHIMAVKTNLRVLVAEQYGRQVAPATAILAARGLQQIKMANLPDEREPAEYY